MPAWSLRQYPTVLALGLVVGVLMLAACSSSAPRVREARPGAGSSARSSLPSAAAVPAIAEYAVAERVRLVHAGPVPSDGRPRRARLSIPALGIDDYLVVPYRGTTDDAEGTRIQDTGVLASPYGPRGGVGPGGVGNYLVAGHRLSSTQAFLHLPELATGERVLVRAGGTTYVYEVRRTRETSFREPASLRAQRAAVPGRPGVPPTRAMITLSTCATPEDHAAGNFWSDEFGNPEHRIDKVGVLVAVRR